MNTNLLLSTYQNLTLSVNTRYSNDGIFATILFKHYNTTFLVLKIINNYVPKILYIYCIHIIFYITV